MKLTEELRVSIQLFSLASREQVEIAWAERNFNEFPFNYFL